MKPLILLAGKLHAFAGARLYIDFLAMVLVGFVNGIGLLLLIPMLRYIGVSSINIDNVPMIASLFHGLQGISVHINLPVVLAFYLVLTIGQSLLQRGQILLDTRIQQGFSRHMRVQTYQAILQADWEFYLNKRKSDFNHVLTSELGRVAQATSVMLGLFSALFFSAIQIGLAFWASVPLTSFVLISGLILTIFSRKGVKKAKNLGKRTTELSQNFYAGISDQLNGIKDIKSNMLEQSYLSWFRTLSLQMERNFVQFKKLQMNTQFFYNAISALLICSFIFVSRMVFQAEIEHLILIILVFMRLWPQLVSFQNNVQQLATSLPALQNLLGLQRECEQAVERTSLLPDSDSHTVPLQISHGIEFRDVHYRYNRHLPAYALQQIDLRIPAKCTTAVVGKSGAGKSTLIDLLIGLLQPERGEILVDGVPVDEGRNRYALRKSISYVPQDPFLFNATLKENLLMVKPDATEEQLWEALRWSASDEFVAKLPAGLDAVIGDRGTRLSGGERQRIVLARALLKKSPILVLDEATSALDHDNETKIQAALDKLKGSMTIIVIAHRMSTIRGADQVVVLEDGRIVQQGGFQQLVHEKKGAFQHLLDVKAEASV